MKRIDIDIQRRGRVVPFLLNIREVPCSNFGPETGYPDILSGLPPSLRANAKILP
jgi:hypothetical protein